MRPKGGNTWWSGRFLRSLERLDLSSRVHQAREVASEVSVRSMALSPGCVESRVFDTREYICRIQFAALTDLEWEESFERLAFADLSAAALLTTGRLPPQIEDFFTPSGRTLLPQKADDLEFACDCRERGTMCKHLAATAHLFAERLDRDPWLLFLLRGRSSDEVMEALAKRWDRGLENRGAESHEAAVSEADEPLTGDVDRFWSSPAPIEIDLAQRHVRPFSAARRLGSPEPKVDVKLWTELLGEVYGVVAQHAESRLERFNDGGV